MSIFGEGEVGEWMELAGKERKHKEQIDAQDRVARAANRGAGAAERAAAAAELSAEAATRSATAAEKSERHAAEANKTHRDVKWIMFGSFGISLLALLLSLFALLS